VLQPFGGECYLKKNSPITSALYWKRLQIPHGEFHETWSEHEHFCMNGLPVPLDAIMDAKELKTALHSAMSHYNEMERPDTMPVEDLPVQYVNWVIAKGYLAVNVRHGCTYDERDWHYHVNPPYTSLNSHNASSLTPSTPCKRLHTCMPSENTDTDPTPEKETNNTP
jgi:hypothetical protein